MIVINFKNYKTGKGALSLARKVERVLPGAIVCVLGKDVKKISEETGVKVFGQKYSSGLKNNGADGTLLNHSDYRVSIGNIKKTLKLSHQEGIEVILCGKDLKEIGKFLKIKDKPMAIAYEDEELIGSGRSITDYRAGDVEKFVRLLRGSGIKPYCGAGISSVEDVRTAGRLGCKGVLISSAVAGAKVKNPEKLLRELR
jgi:triosephosphate isomerase